MGTQLSEHGLRTSPTIARRFGTRVKRFLQSNNQRQQTTPMAMSVLAMQANATITSEREVHFDTDSVNIGIDNRCSACISHEASDFEGEHPPLQPHCSRALADRGLTNVRIGTLKWSWGGRPRRGDDVPDSKLIPRAQMVVSDYSAHNIGHRHRVQIGNNVTILVSVREGSVVSYIGTTALTRERYL
jgi:hypothetical protein